MKSTLLASTLTILSLTTAFASEGDLSLPEARWVGKFTAYVCDKNGNVKAETAPTALAEKDVVFGTIYTDYSLDNVLIKATFNEDGVACNYSALVFADNAAWTASLVDSKAYAPAGGSECLQGKAVIDSVLKFNKYAYLHGRVAIFSAIPGSEAACGKDAREVGLHFQATGKL